MLLFSKPEPDMARVQRGVICSYGSPVDPKAHKPQTLKPLTPKAPNPETPKPLHS